MVCKCGINPKDRNTHKLHDWSVHTYIDTNSKDTRGTMWKLFVWTVTFKFPKRNELFPFLLILAQNLTLSHPEWH